MTDLLTPHPDRESLTAFAGGVLSDRDCATIEEHVAGCPPAWRPWRRGPTTR
jgi:hypothetical protein